MFLIIAIEELFQVPTYYFNKRNAKVEDEMRQKKVFSKKKGAPLLISLEEGIALMKAGGIEIDMYLINF